jgi:hypothetical protein
MATSIMFGLDRSYRFEIAVISIVWLALIINGILLALVFRHELDTKQEAPRKQQ